MRLSLFGLLLVAGFAVARFPFNLKYSYDAGISKDAAKRTSKDAFIEGLLDKMTTEELIMQLYLMFGDAMVGFKSDNTGYDLATRLAPTGGVGVVHDWYPTNSSQYNSLQKLNIDKSRLKIPFMQFGECLHGVGSFKQSMFPQNIGLGASFDQKLAWDVGRAIGAEASSIGIRGCLSPILDIAKEPRWGRVQEGFGEDFILTSFMGVAYARGLSKNGSLSDHDAVAPIAKHFVAHGSARGGLNAGPFMGRGYRQVMQEMMVPFKAVIDLGGAKGVMMSYNELDEIPTVVHPMLYEALSEWDDSVFRLNDDNSETYLFTRHTVASSPADAIQQFYNVGGTLQFYDFRYDIFFNATVDLVANNTIPKKALKDSARRILSAKYDLGLFDDPYIPDSVDSAALTASHVPLTLEAAHRSIVLLENRDNTLPIMPAAQGIKKIALVGPFSDILNYGDYSGQWGAYPVANSSTIRQAMSAYLAANASNVEFVSSWGANTWLYNAQHNIPGYLLSTPDGVAGGLRATYYANTNFTDALVTKVEAPNRDWGLYPPPGLPSNNFSVVWEGTVAVPVEHEVNGWLGVGVNANTTATLFIDGAELITSPATLSGNILGNIQSLATYVAVNGTAPPPGSVPFTFKAGATHKIRLEYQAWNYVPKIENLNSINAQVELFWNLVDKEDAVGKAVDVAKDADVIVLAVGANWNSDGESGDRATLGLSANQTILADAIFALGKPVVLVLQGGRPFAIPEYYAKAAAALDAFFPGQSGGQAISNVLFGLFNPGGRVPISVPYDAATLPAYYNYKFTAHARNYTDIPSFPIYSFGYGKSYSTFTVGDFKAATAAGRVGAFGAGDTIEFRATVKNDGPYAGSYVTQVYQLVRVSTVTRALQQLVSFERVYLDVGETRDVVMPVEVNRYFPIVNRRYEWELESGPYTFALMDGSGIMADKSMNLTMVCD
ncbi:Glycoside hydrolase family 3 protein [Mycena kentingensis (nom. inval.)]|nr:Glycoside hydrolase family 3 protein [Mycena kentingensis (nom. inval.)]